MAGLWSPLGRRNLLQQPALRGCRLADPGFQVNVNDRTSTLASSPSTAVTSNLTTLVVPANHPANPFGRAVRPSTWRPITKAGTRPSVLSGNGMALTDYNYYADSYKFGGEFKIADTTWQGEAWIGYQD